jgi:hypothetical protein
MKPKTCHIHNWLRALARARSRWSEALDGRGNLLLRAVMVPVAPATPLETEGVLPRRIRATARKRRADRPPTAYRLAPSEAYDEALMRLERVGALRWRFRL